MKLEWVRHADYKGHTIEFMAVSGDTKLRVYKSLKFPGRGKLAWAWRAERDGSPPRGGLFAPVMIGFGFARAADAKAAAATWLEDQKSKARPDGRSPREAK